jgi:putative membrane protein
MTGAGAVLAVTWWCHTLKEPWSWTPRVYLGVWLLVALMGVSYGLAMRRRHRTQGLTPGDRRAMLWFALGLGVFWLASDWPIATLGGAYLLSVHVVIYIMYTFGAAPLLLVGMPRWMFERILARTRTAGLVTLLATPWIAGVQINLVLLITHLPPVVDTLRSNQAGSFLLDAAWVASAIVAWLPVASPRREDRIASPIYTCAYLFLAFQVFPMLPGSLITFASLPIYRVYELAPRIGSWSAVSDQQLAGALMAIGCTPVVWTLIGVIFIRAADGSDRDQRHDVYDTATGIWTRADGSTDRGQPSPGLGVDGAAVDRPVAGPPTVGPSRVNGVTVNSPIPEGWVSSGVGDGGG